ncbi:zinc finger FYVE domain-containing protein 1-like [Neocloeon triangulifer]|uniref:zinc finger FYVE domain-containing protein 1-like n=1 Tax=Neocloeon triangulifer TaxID=2078957 RepID=UPI00286EB747|nr:zinc finger FYVE domain-containing protein 1-like [Neocloeon triangulifer]XP_059480763.1 zinc finger FYVE domain-containing protein 1-like [Neocloeon triangulifer]XP_059480765.1 zinc finger FYVE domain-containing protein 1-like [Neocloeon triangulifer]XP_059480766.1 zinc finger FYVE domain-containing protein 1-like [Neocloeon triangulifer]
MIPEEALAGSSGGSNKLSVRDEDSSAILASIDTPSLSIFSRMPNISLDDDLMSLPIEDSDQHQLLNNLPDVTCNLSLQPEVDLEQSFLLIDGKEHLKVSTSDQFASRLGCEPSTRVKVVSVFGNTGDGKSHTLNRLFFEGREVLPESSQPDPCTMGVRAAFCPAERVICLDTEGLLGATNSEHQRTRLLLKVLAVSDLVLYRTRSERLHRDLFTFLGTASKAYLKHFADALNKLETDLNQSCSTSSQDSVCNLGPAVLIFHETRHTEPLKATDDENNSPEEQLRKRFSQLGLDLNAFSSLRYVGVQCVDGVTNFGLVKTAVQQELSSTAVRSARASKLVLGALRVLNDKFSGRLQDDGRTAVLPAEYFSCAASCASCGERCELSMGHLKDGDPHACVSLCTFQSQFRNCEYLCTACYNNGHRQVVVPKMAAANEQASWLGIAKYAWSGYVLECSRCGVIYRSRQYWYGNKEPEQGVVRGEVVHVWRVGVLGSTGHNTARRILDGVSQLSDAVVGVSKAPSVALSAWVADQIAPKYWRPNSEISHCHQCGLHFDLDSAKHHCRACGEGFCDACSAYQRAVPERGWGQTPVRVCQRCRDFRTTQPSLDNSLEEIRARKYGEVVFNTLTNVASVLEYPKELIKSSVQPEYWVPDSEVKECYVCRTPLPTAKQKTHHCRECGQGVCQPCSGNKRPVPSRGWDTPVRVCDSCFKRD